jgi:chromosome segregation ATPase
MVLQESFRAALHTPGAFSFKEDVENEISESFVNFEDVRILVENKMQDEINQRIKEYNNAKDEYFARKDQLDKENSEVVQKYKEECYKQLEARFDQQITGLKYNLTEQSGKVSHLQGVIDTKDEEIAKLKEEIEALTKKKSHWWG